jgi:myosin-6
MRYKNKCVIQAQKYIRGYLARKQHRPRYQGIVKINSVKTNVKQMENVANQLKNEREVMMKQMKEIEIQIDTAIKSIKVIFIILN